MLLKLARVPEVYIEFSTEIRITLQSCLLEAGARSGLSFAVRIITIDVF